MLDGNLRKFYLDHHERLGKYGRKTGGGERIELLKKAVGTGKRVLDLGCRDGSLTRFIMEGNEVVGADIDDIALGICRESLGIETHHVDLNEKFPFADESFDAVVAGELIEHIVIPEYFVEEAARVLRSGGVFCGTTPNAYRLLTRLDFLLGRPISGDPTHLHYFSYDSLKSLLKGYFSYVVIVPYHGHIIGSNKFGIPVKADSPTWIGKLFSRHFFWEARKS